MMCDGAGWHDERALTVRNVTLALGRLMNQPRRAGLALTRASIAPRPRDTEAISTPVAKQWIVGQFGWYKSAQLDIRHLDDLT